MSWNVGTTRSCHKGDRDAEPGDFVFPPPATTWPNSQAVARQFVDSPDAERDLIGGNATRVRGLG